MARFKTRGYHKIRIAPRLASGESRVPFGHSLPDYVKEGIRLIAEREHKSMSWVMEEVIIQYFGFRTPKYIKPKVKEEEQSKQQKKKIA